MKDALLFLFMGALIVINFLGFMALRSSNELITAQRELIAAQKERIAELSK